MKRSMIAGMAAAVLLGAGAGTSYAYLTDRDDVENIFQVSEVNISIKEEFPPVPEIGPGMVITKSPRVVSSSSTDCYVRAMVRFSDSGAENFCQPLTINSGWSRKEDGYYYWQEKLKPGQTTGSIFDKVEIRASAAQEELVGFDVLVYAEAVQCGSLGQEDAWSTM